MFESPADGLRPGRARPAQGVLGRPGPRPLRRRARMGRRVRQVRLRHGHGGLRQGQSLGLRRRHPGALGSRPSTRARSTPSRRIPRSACSSTTRTCCARSARTRRSSRACPRWSTQGEFTMTDLSNLAKEVVDQGAAEIGILHRPNTGPDYLMAFAAFGVRFLDEADRPAAAAQGRDAGGARVVRLERPQRRHAREQHRDVVGRDPGRLQAGEGLRLSITASGRCPSASSATPRARSGRPTRTATSGRSAGSTRRRRRRAASRPISRTRSSTS